MALSETLKLALTYAEESSKRGRWIVFILQLAVILVLSSFWLQEDNNWLQLRLDAARSAVKLLSCEPQTGYAPKEISFKIPDNVSTGDGRPVANFPLSTPQETRIAMLSTLISANPALANDSQSGLSKEILNTIKKPTSSKIEKLKAEEHRTVVRDEDLDQDYSCATLTKDDRDKALTYLKDRQYSLAEAKMQLAYLHQLRVDREIGVAVPVLGFVFDINDLSIMSGITFTILLLWLHFALRRQHDNVSYVFRLAVEDAGANANDDQKRASLKTAYDLLAMTQVLTIPPTAQGHLEKVPVLRQFSRLPALIMWTAVMAQLIVVWDDIKTMPHGDALGASVSHIETVIASCLFALILFLTIKCFRLTTETYEEWIRAYKLRSGIQDSADEAAKIIEKRIKFRINFGWALLLLVLAVHACAEYRQGFHSSIVAIFWPILGFGSWLSQLKEWITLMIVFPLTVVLGWHIFVNPINSIRKIAAVFAVVVALDASLHILVYLVISPGSQGLEHLGTGFYSLPTLIFAALNIAHLLRKQAAAAPEDTLLSKPATQGQTTGA